MSPSSLQETFAPKSICFGCGPANAHGLQIQSRVEGDEVVCDWTPKPHHHAFPGVLNGGVIGALLDCHCNWTGVHTLMQARGLQEAPAMVTAEYTISMRRPTPMGPLRMRAKAVEVLSDRVTVDGSIEAGGKVTATCRGVFVAVKPGHPAYHRW